jgi:hypothetical protein
MRGLAWLAWLIGLGSFAWVTYLNNSYASTMPRTADLRAGRTAPILVKRGTRVFVSPEEAARFDRARSRMNLGLVFCVFGTAILVASKRGRSEL